MEFLRSIDHGLFVFLNGTIGNPVFDNFFPYITDLHKIGMYDYFQSKCILLTTLCTAIMKSNNSEMLPAFIDEVDAYRAYLKDNDYVWGSNQVKSQVGNMYWNMIFQSTQR